MLHLDESRAAELANMIAPRTKGNPYDTVELLHALRRDGVLLPGDDGWTWDATALQRLGQADVADLLVERAGGLPPTTRALLEAMACIGGRVEVGLLTAATGQPTAEVEDWGATAKVNQLDWAYPTLQSAPDLRSEPARTGPAMSPPAGPALWPVRSICSVSWPVRGR